MKPYTGYHMCKAPSNSTLFQNDPTQMRPYISCRILVNLS